MVEEIEKLPKRVRLEWDDLARRVLEPFAFPICGALIVGYSGGADSTALLYACAHLRDNWMRLRKASPAAVSETPPRIIAAHFDHRLRPESGEDAERCKEVARKLGAEFATEIAGLEGETASGKGGVETAARNARQVFLTVLALEQLGCGTDDGKNSVTTSLPTVLLAHTMDEQAETVIMNLARGAGMKGAAGMAARLEFLSLGMTSGESLDICVHKPFLGVKKKSLIELLEKTGIGWLEDPTNLDPDYSPRNRIRNAVLPELEKCYPSAVEKIARFAGIVGETVAQLDAMADEFTERHKLSFSVLFPGIFIPGEPLIEGALIRRSYLQYLPSPLRGQVFFKLLLQAGFRFSYQIMGEIDRLLKAPPGRLGPCGLETSKHFIWVKPPACDDNDPIFLGEPFGEELLSGEKRSIEGSHVNAVIGIIGSASGLVSLGLDLNDTNQFCITAPLKDARLPLRFAPLGKHKIPKEYPGKGREELRRHYIEIGIPPSVVDRMKVLEDARGRLLWHPVLWDGPEKSNYPKTVEGKTFVMLFTGSNCRFPG